MVPAGNPNAPVPFELESTAERDKFRALLMSVPYAVNVPELVKVW